MAEHTDATIANTILSQLGGNKFRVMTGAKDFVNGERSLNMTLPSGMTLRRGNRMTIRLDPDDTYSLIYTRFAGTVSTPISRMNGIYADGLCEIFTRMTGLEVSLGRR